MDPMEVQSSNVPTGSTPLCPSLDQVFLSNSFQCIKRSVVLTTEWLPCLQTVATANLATQVACSQNLKATVVHTNAISHPRNWTRH